MQSMKQEKISAIIQDLITACNGLPFEVEQAWMFSASYMTSYLSEHAAVHMKASDEGRPGEDGRTFHDRSLEVPALLATGRLEWLLRETRPALSGLLSESDVATLLDCYQSDILFPGQFNSIASDLCDHLGIELDDYETSDIATLVDKLRRLNSVQRVTLADALEQVWHRGMKENLTPKEFLATLGIELT
jgi:hypothetical protein